MSDRCDQNTDLKELAYWDRAAGCLGKGEHTKMPARIKIPTIKDGLRDGPPSVSLSRTMMTPMPAQ